MNCRRHRPDVVCIDGARLAPAFALLALTSVLAAS